MASAPLLSATIEPDEEANVGPSVAPSGNIGSVNNVSLREPVHLVPGTQQSFGSEQGGIVRSIL
jgi:hypothetical protein